MITIQLYREERRTDGGATVRFFRHRKVYLFGVILIWHTETELVKA